jgi:septin family protein
VRGLHRGDMYVLNLFRFQEIVGHLERQYDDILAEESRIKRNPRFRDNRVHALLYFIPPTGHSCVFSRRQVLNEINSIQVARDGH